MFRRQFLKGSAACALSSCFLPSSLSAQGLMQLRIQMGWISNVEHAGHYIALENDWYEGAGLDVSISPGGPNAPSALTMVAADQAEMGYTNWFPFLDAVGKGNDFVTIAAIFQRSPLGLISLADNPIKTAEDILGKKILLQGATEISAIDATLALNQVSGDWEPVTAGYSPEPLLAGAGDGYTAYETNQTITLEKMGMVRDKDFFFRSFDELGFLSYTSLAFVTREFLEANRPALVKYLAATMKGWKANADDLTIGPKLMVEKYGRDLGLDLDQQKRQNELQIGFIWPGGDRNFPMFQLDKAKMSGPMYEAARQTGRNNLPPIDQIVDNSLVEEARASLG